MVGPGQIVAIGGDTAFGQLCARPLYEADVEHIAQRIMELLREESK